MRRPVIAGNWKMHKTQADTREFFTAFKPLVANTKHCDIIIAPPFTALAAAAEAARGTAIAIAAQDAYWEREGAFTSEVSIQMISEAGCRAVILGHSERRRYCGETDATVNLKLKAALTANLQPIVCVGETVEEREAGYTKRVLDAQFSGATAALTPAEFSRILLAYEPVWAIGTGRTATPETASESHGYLRRLAEKHFGDENASALRILYGGSVRPDNIRSLMAQEQIDGALVGGASLDPQSFASIVNY
ncbi:MAG TPA: triose-phosphate isomerase [Candidatus Acidoferrales bacterium]|nr:triose-phosphate isomerase [Candidatus Acidoferrales bacterium]